MRIEQAAGLNGNRYATFHQLNEDQAQKLREYHKHALSMYPSISNLLAGTLPKKANEIALSEDTIQYLEIKATPGDTISLKLSISTMDGALPEYAYSADFVLTGILKDSYIGYASDTVNGIVGNGTAKNLLPEEYLFYSTDFKTRDKHAFQSTLDELSKSLGVDERYIQYNWILLDALGISYREKAEENTGTGFSFMTAACILTGTLVLFAAGLVIYNILKISVVKRIKEYGTLRAIGARRTQLYSLVSLELFLLCGIGIPVGLLFGTLSSKGILIAASGMLNPKLFLADSASELNTAIENVGAGNLPLLLFSAAVTLLFALFAAFTRLSVFMPGQGDIQPFDTDLSLQSHETLQLVNIDEARLQSLVPDLSEQSLQNIINGTGCLAKNPIAFSYGDTTVQHTSLSVGDTICLNEQTLRISGFLDTAVTIGSEGFTNGVQLLVNEELYCSLLSKDSYEEIYPTLRAHADVTSFEARLKELCTEYPGTHWLSYQKSSSELKESFAQIKMLCIVLILFIGTIGVLNILNTVYSNIHTRAAEIGIQRALGMSAASLYKTFLWEGAYYGMIAAPLGAALSYVCCIFIGAAATDAFQLVAVPLGAIAQASILSIAVCLTATAIPLRSIAGMNIVDCIETSE